jgi:putative flavoprotein involved in K+ transport
MTDTATATAPTTNVSKPSQQAQRWLDAFGAALASGNPDAVLPLFDADCYWRDLVSFTWNILTQEGHGAVREMLAARQAETGASNFQLEGEATEADGVTDAWFTFETRVARGRGHLRLKGDKAWTLPTSEEESLHVAWFDEMQSRYDECEG